MHTCLRKYIKSVIKWDLIRKLINFWKIRKNLLKSHSFFYPAIVSVLIRLLADKMIIPAQLDAVLAVNNIEIGERGLWLRNFMAHSLREMCPCSELFFLDISFWKNIRSKKVDLDASSSNKVWKCFVSYLRLWIQLHYNHRSINSWNIFITYIYLFKIGYSNENSI